MDFVVKGTQSRPSGLPLIVLSNNTLNPLVRASRNGLRIRVVTTTVLPWEDLRCRDTRVLFGAGLIVQSGGWDYIVHFHDAAERDRLRQAIQARRDGEDLDWEAPPPAGTVRRGRTWPLLIVAVSMVVLMTGILTLLVSALS